ncbi:hypothetical protein HaLaN_10915, partial [Haematococcus lacustris]
WLDRDTNGCLNLQRIGESRQRPIELCRWDDREALPPVGHDGLMPSSGCIVASNAWWHASGPSSSSRQSSGGQIAPWHWPMGQSCPIGQCPALPHVGEGGPSTPPPSPTSAASEDKRNRLLLYRGPCLNVPRH